MPYELHTIFVCIRNAAGPVRGQVHLRGGAYTHLRAVCTRRPLVLSLRWTISRSIKSRQTKTTCISIALKTILSGVPQGRDELRWRAYEPLTHTLSTLRVASTDTSQPPAAAQPCHSYPRRVLPSTPHRALQQHPYLPLVSQTVLYTWQEDRAQYHLPQHVSGTAAAAKVGRLRVISRARQTGPARGLNSNVCGAGHGVRLSLNLCRCPFVAYRSSHGLQCPLHPSSY